MPSQSSCVCRHAVGISISRTIPQALIRRITTTAESSRNTIRVLTTYDGDPQESRESVSAASERASALLHGSLWKREGASPRDPSGIKSSCGADLHPLFTTSGELFAVERYFTARYQNVLPSGAAAAAGLRRESRSIARVSRHGDLANTT